MCLVLHCELVSPELVTIQQPSIVGPSNMNVLNGSCKHYAKQKHLGCKKGEANQKQQLSDYKSIHSYTCD